MSWQEVFLKFLACPLFLQNICYKLTVGSLEHVEVGTVAQKSMLKVYCTIKVHVPQVQNVTYSRTISEYQENFNI